MSRYKKIRPEALEVGKRVKITHRYYLDGHDTSVIAEGTIEDIETSTRKGISLDPSVVPPKTYTDIDAVRLFGFRVDMRPGRGWQIVEILEAIPPLPIGIGSVVLTEIDRAAVLHETLNHDESVGRMWCWADTGEEVPEHLLNSAEVIYTARVR